MPDTKPCPMCGKKMILRKVHEFKGCEICGWWCGCGHREMGPTRPIPTYEQLLQQEWEAINA